MQKSLHCFLPFAYPLHKGIFIENKYFPLHYYAPYWMYNLTSKSRFFIYERNFVYNNAYQKILLPSSNLGCRSSVFEVNQVYGGVFLAYPQECQTR